jgi:hypothetical protein
VPSASLWTTTRPVRPGAPGIQYLGHRRSTTAVNGVVQIFFVVLTTTNGVAGPVSATNLFTEAAVPQADCFRTSSVRAGVGCFVGRPGAENPYAGPGFRTRKRCTLQRWPHDGRRRNLRRFWRSRTRLPYLDGMQCARRIGLMGYRWGVLPDVRDCDIQTPTTGCQEGLQLRLFRSEPAGALMIQSPGGCQRTGHTPSSRPDLWRSVARPG